MTGTPTRITAHLSSVVVGMDRIILDGPLSWAWAELHKAAGGAPPPLTDDFAADFPLPLERWEIGGTWGWCVSQGAEDTAAWTSVQIRRKPATAEMARFTTLGKHHAGLGPTKARDTTLPGRLLRSASWDALVTDRAELERLLVPLTQLSARWRNGFGRVERWTFEPSSERDGWMRRPLPAEGGRLMAVRPPYWHHSRKAPCAVPA